MKISNWISAAAGMVVVLIAVLATCTAGCSMTFTGEEYQAAPVARLHAYGRDWGLLMTVREDPQYYVKGLAVGGAPRSRSVLYLLRSDGSKLKLSERLYAPQRNGSVTRFPACCSAYPPGVQAVQEIDQKLILNLRARREELTDCHVEVQRKGASQDGDVIFFGEFDPVSERVLLNSYFPGFKQTQSAPFNGSVNELYKIYYENRAALNCG